MKVSEEAIVGRNSVMEAIRAGRAVNKILVARGERQGSIREILALAREAGHVVQEVDPARLAEIAPGMKHQGVIAMVSPVPYAEVGDILSRAAERGEQPFVLMLDEIEDPHNLGAILRTADAAGVHGVIVPKRRSCPLSATVAKTSAGALEYVPVARVSNLAQEIERLKKEGLWVVGADAAASGTVYQADLTGPLLLVVGGEGRGLGRLIRERCDFLVSIPMRGNIAPLNASVACALLVYETVRQRGLKQP